MSDARPTGSGAGAGADAGRPGRAALARLSPLRALRSSFRWKLLAALLGSVAVLTVTTLVVVRSETTRQIDRVTRHAEQRSREAFRELEQYTRAQLSQLSTVFTGSVQAAAALEGALEAGDVVALANDVNYEFEARRIPHSLVAFTDAYGDPVLALLNREPLPGADPADVGPTAARMLDEYADELHGYRVVQGALFSVETLLLDLGRPIGTVTVGVPITDDDAARLGSVIGAEVCFVVSGRCVAGTPRARSELQDALVVLAGGTRSTFAEAAGERWRLVSDRLSPDDDTVWRVVAVPLDAVIAPFERVQRALLLGGMGALLLAALVAFVLSRSLTRPVRALAAATSRVGAGDYTARVDVMSQDELGVLAAAFNDMTEGLALKERYRGVLDKVVSRDVAEELLKGDVVLGGEKRVVTTLFADIVGFTSLTEGMEPRRVIALLNECMERLSAAVEAEGGVVDKYIGDEIMALFGAPIARPHDELRAVRAALAMQHAMHPLNEERARRGEPALQLSVGMNTGTVMAGNMGSSSRLNYTVLGDAVNMAARVQKLAGGGVVLLTGHTLEALGDHVHVRDAGLRELRGFSVPVRVYELLGIAPGAPDDLRPDAAGRDTRPGAAALDARADAAGHAATPARHIAGAVVALFTLFGAQTLHAQILGELPTLENMHISSASGSFQLGFSGRLDLEGYAPRGAEPWIIPDTHTFVAPRLRLFSDAFFGDRFIASAELRVDRGEEPRAGPLDARLDQLFGRFIVAPALALQAGKFVSPFGGWAQRHHTGDDLFIRPPLAYDYRTILTAQRAPGSAEGLLTWKDTPEERRPIGAPVIWGAPYQWGAMLLGTAGPVAWRAAAMNSAPSSEPEEWGLRRGFSAPSFVLNAGIAPLPELRVEASFNTGPWLREDATGLPAGADAADYAQRIWGLEAVYRRARTTLRGELLHDTWGVPNVGYGVVDVSWYVEATTVVTAGTSLAARYGAIHFRDLPAGYGGAGLGPWDDDVHRLQLSAGYRIARNAGARAELSLNRSAVERPHADLVAVQLWWEF